MTPKVKYMLRKGKSELRAGKGRWRKHQAGTQKSEKELWKSRWTKLFSQKSRTKTKEGTNFWKE